MSRRVLAAVWTSAVLAAAASGRAQSGIDGTLVDGTRGGPGRADRVVLMRMQGGPSQIGLLDNPEGRFHFDVSEPGPFLIQAQKGGVTYTQMIPPQERGVATPELVVYDTTTDIAGISVQIHMVVIVDGPKLHISRVFEILNSSEPKLAIVGPRLGDGAFRFDLPDSADAVVANVTSGGRLPLRQDPVETPDGKGKTVAAGIKPGTTRLEVDYEIPYQGAATLEESLYHGARALSVVVVPAAVEVESQELGAAERQERQGVAFWLFSGANLEPGKRFSLKLRGQASAPQPPAASAEQAGPGGSDQDMRGEIKEALPASGRGATRVGILAVSAAALLAGLGIALGRPAPPRQEPVETHRRKSSPRAEALLDEIAAIDAARAAGNLSEAAHRDRRLEKKRELLAELDAARRKKKGS